MNLYKKNRIIKSFMCCMLAFAMAFSVFQTALVNYPLVVSAIEDQQSEFTVENGVIIAYSGTSKELVIPDMVNGQVITAIGKKAFSGKKITSIKLPNTLESIGEMAFASNSLTSLELPSNVKVVGVGAFMVNNISNLVLNESIEEIQENGFFNNPIVELKIPGTVKDIGKRAFSSQKTGKLSTLELGEGVEHIGIMAFDKNALTKVTIPDSVTNIDDSAFANNEISEVILGASVERIGAQAFTNNKLTSMEVPSTLNTIYWHSFKGNVEDAEKFFNIKLREPIKLSVGSTEDEVISALNENVKVRAYISIGAGTEKRNVPTEFKTWIIESFNGTQAGQYTATCSYKDFEDIGVSTGANEELAKLIVTATVELQETEQGWGTKHFIIDGTTIKGFSDAGKSRFATDKDLVIPSKNIQGENIDSIGDKAFNIESYGTEGIKSVVLPETIKNIGLMAFRNNNITSLVLPNSVETIGSGAFASNKDLSTLTLSNNLKLISTGAFSFSNIETLIIPEGVTEIGGSAFSENKKLSNLTISNTVTKIGSKAFWGANIKELTIPGNVSEIGSDAFLTGNLERLILGEGIEKINTRAFKSNQLKEVIIPKSVKTLGKDVFAENSDVTVKYASLKDSIERAEGISTSNKTEASVKVLTDAISAGKTLNNKSDATLLEVNSAVTTIENAMAALEDKVEENSWQPKHFSFNGTTIKGFSEEGKTKFKDNKDLVIPSKNSTGEVVTSIGTGAFWSDTHTQDVDKIKSLVLPDTIEVIEARAFGGNLLEKIQLPKNLKSIGDGAFLSNNISDMQLNEGLVSVGDQSFGLNKLTKLTIPTTMRKIGHRAFFNNIIYEITILPGIEKIGDQCFENNKIQTVDLPDTVKVVDLGGFLYNSVKSVKFPKGLKVIGPKAFGVNDIESVVIPDSVELFCPNSFRKNKGFESGEFKIFVDKIVNLSGDFNSEQMKDKLDQEIKVRAAIFKGLVDEDKHIMKIDRWEKAGEEDGYLIFRGKFEPVPVDEIKCGSGTSCENTVDNMKMTSLIVKVKLDGKFTETVKPVDPAEPTDPVNPTDPEKPTDPSDQDKEPWESRHFTFDGTAITGFSELGKAKFKINKKVVIPEKTLDGKIVDSIGNSAFNIDTYGSDGIRALILPNTIKRIGTMAFRNNNIENLVLQDNIIELGEGAFASNRDLVSLTLSKGLKIVPKGAFSFSKISKLVLHEGIEEIGQSAFAENKSLAELVIPSTLKKFGAKCFWNAVIVELTIPGTVKEICDDAFTSGKLSTLILEEGIEIIGNRAFKRNKLSEVIIPKSVKYFDASVFERNPSINVKYASMIEVIAKAEKLSLEGLPQEKVQALQALIEKGKTLNEQLIPNSEEINAVVLEIENAIKGLIGVTTRPISVNKIDKSENAGKVQITVSSTSNVDTKGVVILKIIDNNGRAYKVIYKESNFIKGDNEIVFEVNASQYAKGIKEIKVYVWDNFDNMRPLV
ncbi:Leucine rich repeat-containing protein [Hathewaya proteolytica DSM 3090]|uniref:Leucine rich repeat-containing protein n=1 Tax=Hathewaya proteolytica DSM 3090 TaxID=1121331 RepID=A0A1M6PLU7_9CLOT|nr:leucine-rich repeat protein [Hathewaya proteolytica]SHK08827.1 Leucine rich repeat-containing protein [Hathewaya proteolytica DSM 3090]